MGEVKKDLDTAVEQDYPSNEDMKRRIIAAIRALYKRDGDLLDVDANERSITHKLAEYLGAEFPSWHVDCEYNRRGSAVKRLSLGFDKLNPDDLEAKTVFPDIIVHHRQTDDNLLVIEMKKNGNDTTKDEAKLEAFTGSEYGYFLGLLLVLKENDYELQWFAEGEKLGVSPQSKLEASDYGE